MPNISTAEQSFGAGTNPANINTTCPAGATVLYVACLVLNAVPQTVTWNGVGLTKVKETNNGGFFVSIWRLSNPDAGAHTLAVNESGTNAKHVACLFADAVDVSGTPEDGSGATGSGNSTSSSTNITTTVADTLLIDVIGMSGNFSSNYVPTSPQVRFGHANSASSLGEGGMSYKIVSASGTNNMAWSWTSSLGTQTYATCIIAAKLIVAIPDDDERDAELHGQDTANSERDAETSGVGAVALTAAQDGEAIHLEWDYPA